MGKRLKKHFILNTDISIYSFSRWAENTGTETSNVKILVLEMGRECDQEHGLCVFGKDGRS